MSEAAFTTVVRVGEIPEGEGRTCTVGDRSVAVFLAGGKYYALDDRCPHMGDSLGLGEVHGETIVCPQHLWVFNLADGSCVDSSTLHAETFEVRIHDGEIQVRIPESHN